jgi:release factor glutamine methyltransferase
MRADEAGGPGRLVAPHRDGPDRRGPMTVQQHVARARDILRESGIGVAESESSARVLAEHVLQWDTTRYLTLAADPEPPDFADRYDAAVRRRAAREPSAYITGCQEFWGLRFEVSRAVLIPRPSTELIVEAALEVFAGGPPRRLAMADACTGCGNLAIALAHELPTASIVATDISEAALDVARRNAERHRVADRVRFVHADLLEGLVGPFDLIAANPPYVRQGDRPALQPEVRDYEPSVALFGGASGTDLVAQIVEQASPRLRPGGYLMFEFGLGQDVEVEELLATTPALTLIGLRRDLQGIARTAIARRG